MVKKVLDRIEVEMASNATHTPNVDEIQSQIEQERQQIIKKKAPAVLCDAVVSAIESDKGYVGVYTSGNHVYSKVFASQNQLNQESQQHGKNVLCLHSVNSNLVNNCIEYLCDKQKQLESEDSTSLTRFLNTHYNNQLDVLEAAYVKLTDPAFQNSREM